MSTEFVEGEFKYRILHAKNGVRVTCTNEQRGPANSGYIGSSGGWEHDHLVDEEVVNAQPVLTFEDDNTLGVFNQDRTKNRMAWQTYIKETLDDYNRLCARLDKEIELIRGLGVEKDAVIEGLMTHAEWDVYIRHRAHEKHFRSERDRYTYIDHTEEITHWNIQRINHQTTKLRRP